MATAAQALELLKRETASGSAVGQALTAYLQHAEIDMYRQTRRAVDPVTVASFAAQAQGIHSVLVAITPTPSGAQPSRPLPG